MGPDPRQRVDTSPGILMRYRNRMRAASPVGDDRVQSRNKSSQAEPAVSSPCHHCSGSVISTSAFNAKSPRRQDDETLAGVPTPTAIRPIGRKAKNLGVLALNAVAKPPPSQPGPRHGVNPTGNRLSDSATDRAAFPLRPMVAAVVSGRTPGLFSALPRLAEMRR